MEQGKWHQMGETDLAEALQASLNTGLTSDEAAERQKQLGRNELSEGKKVSPWLLFLRTV